METKSEFVKGATPLTLIGHDGNAFAVLGAARKAGRRAGWSTEDAEAFMAEATSGDYNVLLNACMEWFDVR
jgi:hypothetical protein